MLYSNNKTNILNITAIAAALVASVMRIFSLALSYDSYIGYYSVGAPMPIAAIAFFVFAIIILSLCAIFSLKGIELIPSPSRSARYAALLPALAMVGYTVSELVQISSAQTKPSTVDLLTVAVCILSVVFFISLFFAKQPSPVSVICGTAFIVWIALAWWVSYTDFNIAMNSPDKMFFHIGCIGAALFTVAELRTLYGISKPKFYYFSLWTSIIAIATASIPSIVGNICGIYEYYPTQNEDFVLGILSIYAAVRAFSLLYFPTPAPSNDEPEDTQTDEVISDGEAVQDPSQSENIL